MMTSTRIRPLLLWLLAAGGVKAAEPRTQAPLPALIRTQPERVFAAQSHLQGHLAALHFPKGNEGLPIRAHTDALGRTATRFQHYYQGVEVWGAQCLVQQDKSGRIIEKQGLFQRVEDVSVEPTLKASEVLAVAQQSMKAKGAFSTVPSVKLVLVPCEQRVIAAKTHQDGSLNARDVRHRVTGHELAYHVSLLVANPLDGVAQRDYLIHAHSGQVIREWDSLKADRPAQGQGQSQYSGTVTLDTVQKVDGTYDLVDTIRGTKPNPLTGVVGNATYNLDFQRLQGEAMGLVTGNLYNDADGQWGDGKNYDWAAAEPSTSANGETAAVDAHFGLQTTWDTYKNVFHRDGIDDLGTSTFSRVHFGDQYANAFWLDACFCMSYGDGAQGGPWGSPMNALTELDIAGHEMSHGVTSNSANLAYYDEMGGLNESTSDIMGKMVEFYAYGAGAKGDTIPDTGGTWTIGAALVPSGKPERWMYKPSLDRLSPDYWTPMVGNLNVHYSSGPNNRMFYFLSVGASADSASDSHSRFLSRGMTGIGNQKAGQIWYRALTQYMTPDTRYFGARKACILAAKDLYGELSPEYKAVQNAYAGINVGLSADGAKEDFTRPEIHGMNAQGTTGTVSFTSHATDDREVASVDYFVDGFFVGTSTAADFQLPFDSSTISNDAHVLTAIAYDTNQNPSDLSSQVAFTVHNASFDGIQNGGFEWGWESWQVPSDMPDQPYLQEFAQTGANSMLFGLNTNEDYTKYFPFRSAIYQDLKLPSDCDTLALEYWFIATQPDSATPPPTDGVAHDTLTVRFLDASGNTLKTLGSHSNLDDTPDPFNPVWVQKTLDVSDLKGQVVRLQVDGTNDDQGFGTVFLVDGFAIRGTATVQTSAADINADGVVDGYDLALLMASYSPIRTPSNPRADLNGDGVVNDADLDLLLAAFGK